MSWYSGKGGSAYGNDAHQKAISKSKRRKQNAVSNGKIYTISGYAKSITLNGVEKTYTAGNNWINVSTIRVYPDYESDYDSYQYTANAAQIGITGIFGSAIRINLARETSAGTNWMTSRYLLMRVMDEEGTAHWLYDGRLTDYTDADIEK